MREERQVHPNIESVFRRTYSSPSTLPSAANSAGKDADMYEEEICECVDCACVECACGGLERVYLAVNLALFTFCTFCCVWLLKLHLKDVCDCDSRPLFLGPLFLPLYVHIHIYI